MPTEQTILLFLLLLVAIGIGWLLRGRIGRDVHPGGERPWRIPDGYLRGLNHLLNEEQDKALEVFLRMVEDAPETVETHFALGSLFRRRGEVDRAIRIHQNLIARPSLTRQQRQQALYELGEDYMRAGLFDRAESLFVELSQSGDHVQPALRQLLAIYEQQSDWDQAVATAQRLELVSGQSRQRLIAHYHCELAELALESANPKRASQLLKKALTADPDGVRPAMLSAAIADAEGDHDAAIRAYERVLDRDPLFAGEVLAGVRESFRRSGEPEKFEAWLERLPTGHPKATPSVALAALMDPSGLTGRAAKPLVHGWLASLGRPVSTLLDRLIAREVPDAEPDLDTLRALIAVMQEQHGRYLCRSCGLDGNTLYWQCPSCKSWGSMTPNVDFESAPRASALPDGTGRR